MAGFGPLGLGKPSLVVQVKSSDTPVGEPTVRELQGAVHNFGAEYGLMVAWGGYARSVSKDSPREFLKIRLWNAEDFIRELWLHYDKLPDEIKAQLPLKRIWILARKSE